MKKILKLTGLDCANCAAKIEADVQKLPGVTAATLNFMTTKLTIEASREELPAILEQTTKIVNKYEPDVVVTKA